MPLIRVFEPKHVLVVLNVSEILTEFVPSFVYHNFFFTFGENPPMSFPNIPGQTTEMSSQINFVNNTLRNLFDLEPEAQICFFKLPFNSNSPRSALWNSCARSGSAWRIAKTTDRELEKVTHAQSQHRGQLSPPGAVCVKLSQAQQLILEMENSLSNHNQLQD